MKANTLGTPANQKLALHYAGIHRQEDRDARFAVRAAEAEKQFWHMIRVRVPLGLLSSSQYLCLDELAGQVTYNRSLRVTAGQSIQLHGLGETDLERTVKALESAGLAAGCDKAGFEFAIATPPVPIENASYLRIRELAATLCDKFYPEAGRNDEREAPAYSPRKFTVGLALPEDNSANVLANDVGLMIVNGSEGGQRVNVYAGGSLSMPTRRPDTYARLSSPLGSLAIGHSTHAVRAIADIFKRDGQFTARKHTRLKYVVDALGEDAFRREVEREMGFAFEPMIATGELRIPSWRGPHDQQNGEFYYGLGIPFGRIQDAGMARYKSAIRLIVETFRSRVVLSPDQNIILAGLRIKQVEPLERILAAYHVPFGDGLSNLRFEAMACAGLPTCPLALAESERVAPGILDELEAELERLGKSDSSFSFRISGCSIGCIRPNMVDLGAIGRKPGHYDLFVGGSEARGRFGKLYEECVPLAKLVGTIRPLLQFWTEHGGEDESFSDFFARLFRAGQQSHRLALSEVEPMRERIEREIHELRQSEQNCLCA